MLERAGPTQDEVQGQAGFEMANLRQSRTGLPFIVFISQKAGARHDVRVKVSPAPTVQPGQMSTYALRPFRHAGGPPLSGNEAHLLQLWAGRNIDALVAYGDGDIEYTEDVLEKLVSL